MKTNFQKVQTFNKTFGPGKTLELRASLITEEYQEVVGALGSYFFEQDKGKISTYTKAHLLKELIDLLYVTYGAIDFLGWDADEAFQEVQRSNMSKLAEDGSVIRRDDGKVLKGPNYSEASMEQFING